MAVEVALDLPAKERILTIDQAMNLVIDLKSRYFVGTTTGAFDLFHLGHLRYIELLVRNTHQATVGRSRPPFVLIGINADESVRRNKGARTNNRPVMEERVRAEIVAGIRGVDRTFIFSNDWDLAKLNPDLLQVFTGSDNKPEDRTEVAYLKEHGTQIVVVEQEAQRPGATTSILEKIHRLDIH